MATLNNPGKYDCLQGMDPDMPYFLLKASGQTSAGLVRFWAHIHTGQNKLAMREAEALVRMNSHIGYDPEKVVEALACANQMENWYKGRKANTETQLEDPYPKNKEAGTIKTPEEVKEEELLDHMKEAEKKALKDLDEGFNEQEKSTKDPQNSF